MNLSEDDLSKLEQLAAACMKVSEICMVMEIDEDEFRSELENKSSSIYKSHQKGYLETKFQVNRKIIELAKAGSSPAQSSTLKLIQDKELEHDN